MKGDIVLIACIAWFLALSSTCITLLYRALTTSRLYSAIPMTVALLYLGFIALTVQDCFFPGRTPGMFKIVSMGPDKIDSDKKEESRWSVAVTRVVRKVE